MFSLDMEPTRKDIVATTVSDSELFLVVMFSLMRVSLKLRAI